MKEYSFRPLWTKLSAMAIDSNKYMHAAYYDRMAEFFLKQSDCRKSSLYDKCIEEYHKAFDQVGNHSIAVDTILDWIERIS